ncbi:LysR family transcriptional regulator [Gottfriedia acidiceleris]|uniref:LysR family transcriptional regulator n=1 Tax=Gottfriedia acidiceleris TaxID=371036 RepID=UPI0013EE27C5|nr:LysR family transcriptional regulator [Gottfriedia acidiceleris]
MNFEQMEHIVTVANEKSITKASEKLDISTSGLSQSISQLENELGIKIFNRTKRSITPTIDGKIVVSTATSIIKLINKMNNEINKNKNEKHLKIATTVGLNYHLQDTVLKYKLAHNDITFELTEVDSEDIIEVIIKEEYDFAITPDPLKRLKKLKNISYIQICKSHFCLGAGRSSPLYSLEYITPNDLKGVKLLTYRRSHLNLLCKLFNLSPNQVFLNSNRSRSIIEIAKDSDAIFIAPKIFFINNDLVINGDVKMIPVKENNQFFETDYWLIYSEAKGLSNLASDFIKDFLEYIDEFCK